MMTGGIGGAWKGGEKGTVLARPAADLLRPSPMTCTVECAPPTQKGHFNQHLLRAETYVVIKGRSERKQEVGAGAPKRVRWTRPGIDGGHWEGPACSFQRGQRTQGEKKNNKIRNVQSTSNSSESICHFKLPLREKTEVPKWQFFSEIDMYVYILICIIFIYIYVHMIQIVY